MARGFFSGIVWGGVLGLGVTSVASVLAPLPVAPLVSDKAPDAAPAPERVVHASNGQTALSSDRTPRIAQAAPQGKVPDADTIASLNTQATASLTRPQTGAAGGLDAPVEGALTAGLSVAPDVPVMPNPQALAPMAPQPADDIAINTAPAAPPAPSKEKIAGSFDAPAELAPQPAADSAENAIAVAVSEVVERVMPPQAPQAPAEAGTTLALSDSTQSAPATQTVQIAAETQELQITPLDPPITLVRQDQTPDVQVTRAVARITNAPSAVVSDLLPEVSEDTAKPQQVAQEVVTQEVVTQDATSPLTLPEQEGVAQADAPKTDAQEVQIAQADTTVPQEVPATSEQTQTVGALRPAIGTPATTLTDRTNGVTINRPATQTQQAAAAPQPEAAPAVSEGTEDSDQPAILRHAQAFENPDQKPMMSIVLMDDGGAEYAGIEGIEALRNFPYPLTFAVDASQGDAADRMAMFRAEGFEVMALVDLPEGALPTDVETTLSVVLPRLDEVVGVLEGTKGGLQGSRDVSDQVTAILAQSGHGLVTQDKGLNTMPKLARKEGVPADPVFRDFDSKGQSTRVIRRFLDQAAFKAGQEGAVVMLGRLRPETVSALMLWGLQDRAAKVALAPVSAVLTREP